MNKIFLFFNLISLQIFAQITLKITTIPTGTPTNSIINVAGNFQNWNPGSTAMTVDEAGNYTYTIPEATGSVEFKFTRGSFASVETDTKGNEIKNRTAAFTGSPQTIDLSIASWKDLTGITNPHTSTSNVHILSENFPVPQLNRTRRIWIYLPPDYDTAAKKYPVIYMQDGQNLFDNATSFSGEWQVDETLNSLFEEGDYGAIVIGIDNGGENRINEYTPWKNAQYGGGEGDQYLTFIAENLKQFVDSNYRTKPSKEYNALIGSSLGALISNYGAIKYSEIFSKIGSFSPAYWINNTQFNNYITNSSANLAGMRIYFVAGSAESSTIINEFETVKNNLQTKGLRNENLKVKIDSYGKHNENYWKGEFRAAYQWLFSATQLQTSKISK